MNGRPHLPSIAALLAAVALLSNLVGATPSPLPQASLAAPAGLATATGMTNPPATPAPSPASSAVKIPLAPLTTREIPEIHAKIALPADWTLLPGKLLEGDVLLAVREKIAGENDLWTTGLSMTIDRNGAKDSGIKADDYALGIAREAREKAGEEATPITESTNGPFREIRFEFPVQADPPLQVTEVLRANEKTGTVAVILWQSPKSEATALRELREAVLSGLVLDPTQ